MLQHDGIARRRVHILVTGRVQGVFFRQSLKSMARRNGVFGWVKNLDDGRVEAMLEGGKAGVDRVVMWARVGPANSRVDDITVIDGTYAGEFSRFDVRYQ